MILGDPAADMVTIFERPEFDRSPSLLSRIGSAIGDLFAALGSLGPVVEWLLIVALVVAIAYLLYQNRGRFRRPRRRRKERAADIVPITIEESADPAELRAARAHHVQQQDFKQAILFRYREVVAALMARRLVSTEPGRTTGELRLDVTSSLPDVSRDFERATDVFEVTWYSHHPPTQDEFELFDRVAAAILDRIEPRHATSTRPGSAP